MRFKQLFKVKWTLVLYDAIVFLATFGMLFLLNKSVRFMSVRDIFINTFVSAVLVFFCRFFGKIYSQIWRYGGIQCYIRLLVTDLISMCLYIGFEYGICHLMNIQRFSISKIIAVMTFDTLVVLAMRMAYRYCFKCCDDISVKGKFLRFLLVTVAHVDPTIKADFKKIKIAIIGAGDAGVGLMEELQNNNNAAYTPVCFVDINAKKVGREINSVPVYPADEATFDILADFGVQEIIFALPTVDAQRKHELFNYYKQTGCKIKIYDYPTMQSAGSKRHLREFDIEDLLFRKPIDVSDEKMKYYYKDKIVLITGGGGSIGSELCRQLAKASPKKIVILDIYENGVYDVQQELKIKYGAEIDLQVEIASITNKVAMKRVFEAYRPQIVINAAAHKHVPLMEHNCIEAIENNVFGTKNLLELCEEYGTERFMMVSTDKAVNPTNVMGATKRMCEMLVQSESTKGKVKCSATRFGNVLGSAGSVIPLFKKQIASGGPVTLTDKRIIRYFMTIPEAASLVLQSGAMAHNGELFVLDMGQPVKILDLAENMIRLSGVNNVEIVETGLRPGEKLYEELLVKTEELDKTENSMIFIERDEPHTTLEMEAKLQKLKAACASGDDDIAREALRSVVPTFKRPESVNDKVEMKKKDKNTIDITDKLNYNKAVEVSNSVG